MKKLFKKLRRACLESRPARTFWQAMAAYFAIHIPTFWDGGGDFLLALKALVLGAIAAGISALWKTAESNLQASKESGAA